MGPKNFIKKWNASEDAKKLKVFLRAEAQGDNLYGVEFRFSGQRFRIDEETFDKVRNRIYANSKGLVQVTSYTNDFRSGIMHVAVLFCNHGYSPKIVTKTLEFILDEILPDLKIG